jgi:hypothetical protein
MTSHSETDDAGRNQQPEEYDVDDALDPLDDDELEPEVVISDEVGDKDHDEAVVLIATLFGVGALVVILGLGLLDRTGLIGQGCDNHLRSAQCYSPDARPTSNNQELPAPGWPWNLEIK